VTHGSPSEEAEHCVHDPDIALRREVVGPADGPKPRVGERVDELVRGTCRVPVPKHDEHRAAHPRQIAAGGGVNRPAEKGRERGGVVARTIGDGSEDPRPGIDRVLGLHRLREVVDGVGRRPDQVQPHTQESEPTEEQRASNSALGEDVRASRETDCVDWRVAPERTRHGFGRIGIVVGVMRSGRGAVTRQVDGDDAAARVLEKVHPTGGTPAMLARRREPVNEDDRRLHSRRVTVVAFSCTVRGK